VFDRVGNFVDHFRIDPIQQASENSFARLSNNRQDCNRDEEAYERICQWITSHTPIALKNTPKLVKPSTRA